MVADLSTMPHLLIAGTTGSGKTVCMNSILAGLFMARTPEQLQLILIDTKIVEFSVYNHLPHLLGAKTEVITDPKKAAGGLRWAITEMERRYKMMAKAGVRNIKSYNSRPIGKQQAIFAGSEEVARLPERLSYIVIIVDEMVDLMITAQAEIENYITLLTRLSPAVGIHMILATQRPSVDVITGTIKANFPARIAFQVAQKNDSRMILDANGADKLLGRGDMLFMPSGSSKLIRAQGALTSDEDINRIVGFIMKQRPPVMEEKEDEAPIQKSKMPGVPDVGAEVSSNKPQLNLVDTAAKSGDVSDDPLLGKALQIIRETKCASTSSLQHTLHIEYDRAIRIMDAFEKMGIVGPARGSDTRAITPLHSDALSYVKGFEALNQGLTMEALKHFEKVTRFADGYFMVAQIHSRLGNYEKELKYAFKAKTMESELGDLTKRFSKTGVVGSFRVAKYVEVDIKVCPIFVDIMIAEANHRLGKNQKAYDIFEAIVSANPKYPEMKLLLSNFLMLVDPDDIPSLERVVELLDGIDYSGMENITGNCCVPYCCHLKAGALAKLCRFDEAMITYGLLIPAKGSASFFDTNKDLIMESIKDADEVSRNPGVSKENRKDYEAKRLSFMAAR